MASRFVVDQQVLDGAKLLLNLKKGFEWLEKKLRHICGYFQATDQLKAHDLSVKEWRQEVRDIVEHKEDEFLRLLLRREGANWVKHSSKLYKNLILSSDGLERLTRLERYVEADNGELEERIKRGGEAWKKVKANKAQVEICF